MSDSLTRARARYATRALTSSADVERDVETSDGAGGFNTAPAVVHTYACRVQVQETGATEKEIGDRIVSESEYVVLLPWDADVVAKDRLIIGSITLEVVATDKERSDALCLTCQCKKRGG